MPALLMTPRIAALAHAACTVEPAPAPTRPAPPPAPAEPARKLATGPSLVIVTLDTTRADHMGAYGYEKAKTPVFDSLASQGVRFERAYATTPLTTPSHASMFTGLYPPRHGIRNNGDAILADSFQTLAETLQAQGYQTAASVSAFVTTRVWNLDQGFDVYFDQVHQAAPGARWGQERPAGEVVDDLVKWLDEGRDPKGAFVLWAHFYDAHHPYKPPEGFTEGFDMPYDGEIAYVDSQLGRLKQKVDAAAGPEGANWIVLADHGEAFDKQHGEVTHGLFVFDPTMRVPFVLRPAQPLAAPVVMKEPTVGGVDLTPTALGMLGLPVPEGLDGVDLWGWAASGRSRSPSQGTAPSLAPPSKAAGRRLGHAVAPSTRSRGVRRALETHPSPPVAPPALQATADSPARAGDPLADLPSDASTPSVAGAMTTVRSRMRWSQRGQDQESTSNALHRSQAHGTHRDVADGFLASRSAVARPRCARLRPRGRTRSRSADRAASTPWYSTVLARGGGTRDARRSTSSTRDSSMASVPSDQGRLNRIRTPPSGRSSSLGLAKGGRAT